jgi:hypothetical protein
MQIHGYPVAYGILFFAAGLGLWHKKWLHRVAMVAFALAAAFFAIGIVPLQDALARLTGNGPGLVVLVVVALLFGFATVFELRNKRKDARHLAHICAGVTAVASVMVIANSARLLSEAARSPARAGAALSQSVHAIRSGQAASAVNSHQSLVDLGLAVVALAVLVVLARRHEKKTPAKRAPLAITSGRPPSGRPALPNARGH